MIEKWETVETEFGGNFKIFDLYWHKRKNAKKHKDGMFVALKSNDWVNVIPIDTEGNVILVEQYRHGIDAVTIEIPAGLIEKGEAPSAAAERECKEETGYTASAGAVFLGENIPNPAFIDNKCFHYVMFDCEKNFEQSLDENEDINVLKVPLKEINDMILSGRINHSLVLAAFYYFNLKYADKLK